MRPFPPQREEDFAPFFPQEALRRGLAYTRAGRVLRVYRVGERLLGEVQGTAPEPYRLEVSPMGGSCTCPYPGFPCKHMAALLYAYLDRPGLPDLEALLEDLSPEEAKALLKRALALPGLALALGRLLFSEKTLKAELGELKRLFRLGQGREEAYALALAPDRMGEEEVLLFLETLLEAPFDPTPLLEGALERYRALGLGPLPLLRFYRQAPLWPLREAFLKEALQQPEEALRALKEEDPGERALKAQLLLDLGREEEALALLKGHLEEVEDYLRLVQALLQKERLGEALAYAEEARAWFGRDPRLLPLLDLLAQHRGWPEDHEARFALRPNLEDYLALKAKLGRGFHEVRAGLLRRVRDPLLLARILLLEEDWKALDRLLKDLPPPLRPDLARLLKERLPEEALRLYLEAAQEGVEAGHRAGYRRAAQLLKEALPLNPRRVRAWAEEVLRRYPRRRALREELGALLGA